MPKVVLKGFADVGAVHRFCHAIWKKEAGTRISNFTKIESPQLDLTEEDWKLLTKGAKTVKYPPKQVLSTPTKTPLEENITLDNESPRARYIFRVVSGSCTAKAMSREFRLTEGDIFGEISFMTGSSVKVYEVITNETTFVNMIDGYYLNVLFQHYPVLAGKFYRWIAAVLCSRLNVIGYI